MDEPNLGDIAKHLVEIKQDLVGIKQEQTEIKQDLAGIKKEQTEIKQDLAEIKQQLEKLDSRFFDFSMRIVSANSSAFFGVGIALLSAAIAFVVARISSSP